MHGGAHAGTSCAGNEGELMGEYSRLLLKIGPLAKH